jgi:predicted TIM-barrel fold metal-dependent hydrolase
VIIDTHVHIYPPEIVADCESIARGEDFFDAEIHGKAHKWAVGEDVLFAMDEDGVDESWICGFGFKDLGLCRLCNDYVLDLAGASGGKLKPLAVAPPLARGAEAEILRCAERGAIGVGEILPDGQHFNIDQIDETWRFAGVCHEAGLFALIHVSEPVGRDYPGKGCAGPAEAFKFARNHPELRIVFAHCGGGLFLYEHMPEVRMVLQNVWYDTAAAPFLYSSAVFDSVASSGAWGKFLFGSDFPILRYPRYKRMLGETAIIGKDLDGLFCGNAMKLSGLSR